MHSSQETCFVTVVRINTQSHTACMQSVNIIYQVPPIGIQQVLSPSNLHTQAVTHKGRLLYKCTNTSLAV